MRLGGIELMVWECGKEHPEYEGYLFPADLTLICPCGTRAISYAQRLIPETPREQALLKDLEEKERRDAQR